MAGLVARATSSGRPEEALRAVVELRAALDALERRHVGQWLERGATWREIAGALGISRQSAHRRHGGAARSVRGRAGVSSVLVTGQARLAVRVARQEAKALGAAVVGTEHLLLGIMRSGEHRAAQALRELGVTPDAARLAAQPTLVDGAGASAPRAPDPMSDSARSVLEQSLREAVARGEGSIGVEHLLLALLRDEHGGAARTLRALDVDLDAVRARLRVDAAGDVGAT